MICTGSSVRCKKLSNALLYFFYPDSLKAYGLINQNEKLYFYIGDSYAARIYYIESASTVLVDSSLDERRVFLLLYSLMCKRCDCGDFAKYFDFVSDVPTLLGLEYSFTYKILEICNTDSSKSNTHYVSGSQGVKKAFEKIKLFIKGSSASYYDYSVKILAAKFHHFDHILQLQSKYSVAGSQFVVDLVKNNWYLPCFERNCKSYNFSASSDENSAGRTTGANANPNDSVFGVIPSVVSEYKDSGLLIIQQQKVDDSGCSTNGSATSSKESNYSVLNNPLYSDSNAANNSSNSDFSLREVLSNAFCLQHQIVMHTACQGAIPSVCYDDAVTKCKETFKAVGNSVASGYSSKTEMVRYFEEFRNKVFSNKGFTDTVTKK